LKYFYWLNGYILFQQFEALNVQVASCPTELKKIRLFDFTVNENQLYLKQ